MPKSLWDGEETEVNFDLYPRIPHILETAQSKGFMTGSKAEDLVVSSTNMGFEITGTYKCRVSVEDLKIITE